VVLPALQLMPDKVAVPPEMQGFCVSWLYRIPVPKKPVVAMTRPPASSLTPSA
jgi:hypothetical protein